VKPSFLFLIAVTLVWPARLVNAGATDSFPVTIRVHADQFVGELKPIWRFFGADEPNYATMPNGQKLLGELGALRPNAVYFRTHNLLTSGDGTPALKWGSTGAYSEDARGNPIYNWTILDGIFDSYRAHNVRPYVEIGFMPEALSVHPEPYQHHWNPTAKYNDIYTGWAYPPKDYAKWSELIYQWTAHDLGRYGRAEMTNWFWETWNEANIGYWQGEREDFFKLHDYAVDGVRRALPSARVGGPDSAGGGTPFLRAFLEHCVRGTNYVTGRIGTPIDFISFHAKGSPVFTNDHVRMGIANQLRNLDSAFKIIAAFPGLKGKPIVIGESDPDGCAACQGDQLGYRNGTIYASYTAATFARELDLADQYGVNLEGALTWAFEFENEPPFAGFRVLAGDGIDLPVLNVFRMFAKMEGRRVAVESTGEIPLGAIMKSGVRDKPDVSAIASRGAQQLCILVWHYHDDEIPGASAQIKFLLDGLNLAKAVRVRHFRIDDEHSNAFTAWKAMNAPMPITPAQATALQQAGQLAELEPPQLRHLIDGKLALNVSLPRNAISLFILDWE